jgi:hypothetical protein
MDTFLAAALALSLLLRGVPFVVGLMSPSMRRRMQAQTARFWALLDVGVGTLMAILVGLLVWHGPWYMAILLGLISIPTWRAMWAGLRVLARTPPPTRRVR